MSYGFNKPKAKPCTVSGQRHKWVFVRNGVVRKTSGGFGGTTVQLSMRGLYKCACGETRVGQAQASEPGADLRDHVAGSAA